MCVEHTKLNWSDMTFREKIYFVFGNVTVEPMLACYIIPSVLATLANQNLSLEKACRVNLEYPEYVCNALTARQTENFTREETQVQQIVAGMTVWRTFVQSLIPGILIMFLGSWSDRRRRRKPFMLLPIFGEFLSSVSLIFCTYFFYELPMEVGSFFECLFPALTGGWMTMNMAVFSYLGDITTVENRTLRIGVVNVFATAGVPIGLGLSGLLFKIVGFYGVFLITSSTYVVGIYFGISMVKDANKCQNELTNNQSSNPNSSEEISLTAKNNSLLKKRTNRIRYFLKDFFNLEHIRETFSVVLDGERNRRKRVLLLIIVFIVIIGPMNDLPKHCENKHR